MRRGMRGLLLTAVLGVALTVVGGVVATGAAAAEGAAQHGRPKADRPNIVLLLMDDFSLELLETMPNAQQMKAEGATYRNAFVVDSLCCTSRSSLFTGQAPHHTGVLTNTPNDPENPIGGWKAYEKYGNIDKTFHLALERSGYTTGFTGKLLNGYEVSNVDGVVTAPEPIPGWTEFDPVFGGGYNGWKYRSGHLGADGALELTFHGAPALSRPIAERDAQYATTVTGDKALDFVRRHEKASAAGGAPYFLEVATYGPHSRLAKAYDDNYVFPPAFADRARPGEDRNLGGNCGTKSCGDLTLDDLTGYADDRTDNAPTYLRRDGTTAPAPAWRTNEVTLTDAGALQRYRDRARMVQSIDRLLAQIRAEVGENTYVVLTADNGFHLGQHQLNGGKGTPYDSDTRVPLVVVGPDVVPGERDQLVSNLDLAPTFEELGGLRPASYRDGTSFAHSLSQPRARGSRYTFFEHTFAKSQPGEVDTDEGSGGTIDIIPSYIGVRSERGLLVRFDLDDDWDGTDYAWELYTYEDGFEKRNVYAERHREPWVRDLAARITVFGAGEGCAPLVCRVLTR
ncbi:sulfatase-like hydrolase/transferase [Mumia sp. DW29H23]|uniref:sulfatase-like hydrolase/transferase n=1 Tax=Mumia sp. DW29H23 TaxID=3421241 RepID=UPI003D684932